ncbi:hypothetical protein K8T06_08965, partial [bacterium]|nr:hypothetical protein [bacterium]
DLGNKQVFYTNPMNMLSGLVAQRIGIEQNISWATGTHSASPVPVIIIGPESVKKKFPGVLHLTDIGRIMKEILGAEDPSPILSS